MKHSQVFLLQIILLSIANNDGTLMLDEPQDATKLIVLEPTTGKQWFLGPILVDFKLGALGACQQWSSAVMPLQKPLSHASHSRHATTAMKERSDIFLLQVLFLLRESGILTSEEKQTGTCWLLGLGNCQKDLRLAASKYQFL
ncbi:hypothetical protein ISCGN_013138 [Ixodes scapularis]